MKIITIKDVVTGVVLFIGAAAYNVHYCDDSLFTSDATDYLRAVKRGFGANYLDTQSAGLWGVISVILNHPDGRGHLWDYLERSDDTAAQRHFHVPAGLYPQVLANFWGGSDRAHRIVTSWEGALVVAIVFWGLRLAGVGVMWSLFSSILVSLSPEFVSAATDVSPHMLFLGAFLVAGFALGSYLETKSRASLAIVLIATAFASASLELSLVAVFAMLCAAGLWFFMTGSKPGVTNLKIALGVFCASLILCWPGGWIRGGYVLSYGVFAFLALFRRESYFGSDSLSATWMRAAQGSGLLMVLIGFTIVAWVALGYRRRLSAYHMVFGLLLAGFAAQGLLNHFRNPAYTAHFIALFWVLFGLCAEAWWDAVHANAPVAAWAGCLAAVTLAIVAAAGWPKESGRRLQQQRADTVGALQVIDYLRHHFPPGSTIVSNQYIGLWRYYMPEFHIEKSTNLDDLQPRSWVDLSNYVKVGDPQRLSPVWLRELERDPHEKIGGFLIAHAGARLRP